MAAQQPAAGRVFPFAGGKIAGESVNYHSIQNFDQIGLFVSFLLTQ
jgi:hypothetical protein